VAKNMRKIFLWIFSGWFLIAGINTVGKIILRIPETTQHLSGMKLIVSILLSLLPSLIFITIAIFVIKKYLIKK